MTTQNMIESPYSTTPSPNTISQWDANNNLSSNNSLTAYTTIATAGGTTTLTVSSTFQQFFTGSSNQTLQMPVASTLVLGQSWYIVNNSSGVITITSSGGNTIISMNANTAALVTCILTSGTTAASWFARSDLPLSGGTMTGTLNMGAQTLTNLTTPVNPSDSATKQYVDNIASGLNPIPGVAAATTANVNATYNNGSSGVGATLTNAGTLTAFAVDGYSASVGDRILVKNQTSTFQNGIYIVTTVGSGAVAWVLTRATDYNTPAAINVGDLVVVENGTTNAGSSWLETATVVTIGTSPITFVAFFTPASFAKSGANADITSMTGLTGYLQAPLGVKDINGNLVVAFVNVASAVNWIDLSNNATTNSPTIKVDGTDPTIGLALQSKNSFISISDSTNTSAIPLQFYNAGNTFYTALKAGSNLANITFVLPIADAASANMPLLSNGSGVLSFENLPIANIAGTAWSNFTPGFTGFSSNPTVIARFQLIGKICFVTISSTSAGTSNATTFTITNLPAMSANNSGQAQSWPCIVRDNNTIQLGTASLQSNSTTLSLFKGSVTSGSTWTSTGSKDLEAITFFYETT